jgi:hypothetical protein
MEYTLAPTVNSYDGFEEMPIRDCLCLFAHPAHGLDSRKHSPDFRLALFGDERQHDLDVASL